MTTVRNGAERTTDVCFTIIGSRLSLDVVNALRV
jgi:hypothetical protein